MLFGAKVAAARLAATASRLSGSGGGTSLPGKLLVRLAPDALERLASRLPGGSMLVSATNGKTTSAKMAAAILEPHVRLCRNGAGANLVSGVTSAILACGDADEGLFEVDEAALQPVAAALAPRGVVLGNLFRDQLDRYGELELIGERWRDVTAALPAESVLIANADDPLVASIGRDRPGRVLFGIDDPALGRQRMQHAADSKWCVVCGGRYSYDVVLLGHLGHWRCPNCGDGRPAPSVRALAVRADGLRASEFMLQTPLGSAPVRLPIPGIYNVHNALAAAAVGHVHGLSPVQIADGLGRFSAAFGRFERFDAHGRDGVLLLVKNPAGANEVIRTLAAEPARKTLLVGLNDRIADGRDVSWIWDVDFEELVAQVDDLVVTGTRAAEMALRMKYAGLDPARIRVQPAPERALDDVLSSGPGPVYLLCTYTAMLELRAMLGRRGLVRAYWEAA